MPIIHIHSVAPARTEAITPMLKQTCIEGARALACAPSNVWAIFNQLAPEHYTVGDRAATDREPGTHPAIVTVQALAGRTLETKTEFLRAITRTIGSGLGISPENIFVHYVEMNHADVWSKGSWSRS